MTLNALSNTIESNVVNMTNGWGEEVSYKPTVGTSATVRAMVTSGSFLKKFTRAEGDPIEGNVMSFMSVFLSFEPKKGDTITYNGKTWVVQEFMGVNPYDIVATSGVTYKGRSGRQTT